MNNIAFWKWWSIIISICTLFAIADTFANVSSYLIELDTTHLSIFIIVIFMMTSLVMGYFSYLVQFTNTKITDKGLNPLWYASDTVLGIGMIGTLIGFLMVLITTFGSIDTPSALEIKRIISELAHGMGIALITTLTGLISSILIKLQLVILESDNEEV
jgi:hypothetical protein